MDLYVIVRRNGFTSAEDLQHAAARSTTEGDKDGSGVRWIRSYVVPEQSGELGTFCIYEADSPRPSDARRRRVLRSTRSSRSPTPSSCGPTRRRSRRRGSRPPAADRPL